MKKIVCISLVLGVMLFRINNVFAAPSYNVNLSASQIENGGTVTAKLNVNNVASWQISISCTGNTSGNSYSDANVTNNAQNTNKSFSLKCKATSEGIINFSVTGNVTGADGSKTQISTNKQVRVVKAQPKSANNYLSGISIGDYSLTPNFDKNTLEYSVSIPSIINEIELKASKEDATATINGTGVKTLDEGINTFQIVVTAQNGNDRTYTIKVNVEDQDPIKVVSNNEEFSIIKNPKNVEIPELFTETKVMIYNLELRAFYNETTHYTLVAARDKAGEICFLIYNQHENTYTQYFEVKNSGLILNLLEKSVNVKGYTLDKGLINNYNINVLKKDGNADFMLVKAVNMLTGEEQLYQYDMKENTYQRFVTEEDNNNNNNIGDIDMYKYTAIGFAVLSIALIIIIVGLIISKPQKKKKRYIEDEEDKKKNEVHTDESKTEEIKNVEEINNNKKLKKEKKKDFLHEETDKDKKIDVKKLKDDYESTIKLSKQKLDKQENLLDKNETVEDMYNFFDESKKKKVKKNRKK